MARLLCLTGPESSGKSTLAAALAPRLKAPMVPELARDRLSRNAPPVVDVEWLRQLTAAQQAAEAEALARPGAHWVVADTDVLVIALWWRERFAAPDEPWPNWLASALGDRTRRRYVLCVPDMPWAPDPLRQNPADRDRLYERHRELLQASRFPWLSVSGQLPDRVTAVLSWLPDPVSMRSNQSPQ